LTLSALSLQELEFICKTDDGVRTGIGLWLVKDYDDFLDLLYDDIKLVVEQLERNPQEFRLETEDSTTQRIVDMLSMKGYSAHHNAASGGNVDLTVELKRKNWLWIAEAKKFGSVADLKSGYKQLSTRYKTGTSDGRVAYGAILAYLRRPDAAAKMEQWKKGLQSVQEASGSIIQVCNRRNNLGFFSQHKHRDLGIPLRVWHVCVQLHVDPQDKSGLSAKKYK
jgi:hypothetical protein